ncbi:MAG: hypothetical protein K8R90_03070 [Candidatus Cloacimonetes bacterium]|nr:hypothetical protein [Candidatus Cloacimonadota bacterium]
MKLHRSAKIAKTGLTVLLSGLVVSFACFGFFMKYIEQPVWLFIGIGVLLLSVSIELLCLKVSRRLILNEYSRRGMAHKKVNNNDLIGIID